MAAVHKPQSGTAILCLTQGGCQLALGLGSAMGEGTIYVPQRLAGEARTNQDVRYFEDWNHTFAVVFTTYSQIICVMAAGIVVRSLAGILKSKHQDPAVVVVDEKGQYAISLLSGHIGGANQLAVKTAQLLGGQAVITTATDVHGKTAADLLAVEIGAVMDPVENLKRINLCLAENRPVNLYSPWPLNPSVINGFIRRDWPLVSPGLPALAPGWGKGMEGFENPAVIVSPYQIPAGDWFLWLKPRNLVVGIGCRRGVKDREIRSAMDEVLKRYWLDGRCICSLASIDIKADEEGINALAEEMGIDFRTFSREEILLLAGTYQDSAWVEEIAGVGGVCEPAARLGSGMGVTLIPKQKIGPVTISVAMERSWWWDWGRETGII